MITYISKYDNVKTRLCKEQRNVLGTEQNLEDSSKIVFSEEVLRRANNSCFLRIDHTDDSGKVILLVFARKDSEYLLRSRTYFLFLDGTFKCCPKQFVQLYCLHVDLRSTSHENYIYPVLFALLSGKEETTYHYLTLLKNWCVLVTKNYKVRI
jgi:hypothetical protein